MTGLEPLLLGAAASGAGATATAATATATAATAGLFGTTLSTLGTLTSALGAFSSGQQAAATSKTNAALAERDRTIALQEAEAEADDRARTARRLEGTARNNVGANTGSLEGSALDVLADNAANDELDILRITHSGQSAADSAGFRADIERNKASGSKTKGFVGAGAALLRGFGA